MEVSVLLRAATSVKVCFRSDAFLGVVQATYEVSSVQSIGRGVVTTPLLLLSRPASLVALALLFSSRRGLRSGLAVFMGYNPVACHLDLMFFAVKPSVRASW